MIIFEVFSYMLGYFIQHKPLLFLKSGHIQSTLYKYEKSAILNLKVKKSCGKVCSFKKLKLKSKL